jgi:hypothetical protein
MNEQLEKYRNASDCPLCSYRQVFGLECATACRLVLDEMRCGWCDDCHAWLKIQAGVFVNGGVEFTKVGCTATEQTH